MRDYFKYKFGYVNVDAENIYFTSTGNWSETINMQEKGVQKQKVFRKTGIKIFLSASVIALVFLIFNNLNSEKISKPLVIGLPVGLYFAYKYLSTELGSQFKLPIFKITDIEIVNSIVYLTFLDSNGSAKTYQVEKPSEKGISIMTKIKDDIINKKQM